MSWYCKSSSVQLYSLQGHFEWLLGHFGNGFINLTVGAITCWRFTTETWKRHTWLDRWIAEGIVNSTNDFRTFWGWAVILGVSSYFGGEQLLSQNMALLIIGFSECLPWTTFRLLWVIFNLQSFKYSKCIMIHINI